MTDNIKGELRFQLKNDVTFLSVIPPDSDFNRLWALVDVQWHAALNYVF